MDNLKLIKNYINNNLNSCTLKVTIPSNLNPAEIQQSADLYCSYIFL